MAITESVGYEGTVGYDTYSQTVTQSGRYAVEGTGDWKVSAIAGDRMVRVAAGVGRGYGIRDTSTDTDLQHDIALSGVRYDLVVAHRDWSTGETEFQIINGGSTATLPSRTTGPGAADDQPLALVRITAGETDPVVVADLRCWSGDGGVVAVHEKALDYLGERPGTRVTIGGNTHTRVLTAAGAAYWDTNRSPIGETLLTHSVASVVLSSWGRLVDQQIAPATYDRAVDVTGVVNIVGTSGYPWRIVVTSSGGNLVNPAREFAATAPFQQGASVGGSVSLSVTFDLPAGQAARVGVWAEEITDGGVCNVGASIVKIRVRAKG